MPKPAVALIKKIFSPDALLLVAASALIFLPYAFQLTYRLDDWYFAYHNVVMGPNVFHEMFSIDRPARGYFFDIFFSLFGSEPLPSHLANYGWRLAASLGAFQLLNLLWRDQRKTNFLIALLFTLYPGYSWWVTIEYQPIAASLALQILSILFTLLSIRAANLPLKILHALAALATGFAYPALVEYAVGAEVFRFMCIYLLLGHDLPQRLALRVRASAGYWFLCASSSLGFVFWRVFLFESGRKATDVDLFAGKFGDAPLQTLTEMGGRLYLSVLNAGVNVWYRPLLSRGGEFGWDLPSRSLGLTTALAVILVAVGLYRLRQGLPPERSHPRQALALGAVSLVCGVVPVVLFGRFINLSVYSHYGLPVSLAGVLTLAGSILFLPSKRLQYALLSAFILASALANSLLAEKTLTLEKALADFWRQASWRIPGIRPDTTFVTVYPYPNIVDGDLGLPEAANLIYFPEPRDERPLRYPVSAIMPTGENIENILSGQHKKSESYRTFTMILRYDNIVILTQPGPLSCVRVIDGNNFIHSEQDIESIRPIFQWSNVANIRPGESPTLPEYAFGPEPEHGWCYYFEKADLAVQQADWESAARFGDEAFRLGLTPADPAEWYPFIQAYAVTGDEDKLRAILEQTTSNAFFNEQVCERARRGDSNLSTSRELIESYSCK